MNLLAFGLPSELATSLRIGQRIDLVYGENVYPSEIISVIRSPQLAEITFRQIGPHELLGTFEGPTQSLDISASVDWAGWVSK